MGNLFCKSIVCEKTVHCFNKYGKIQTNYGDFDIVYNTSYENVDTDKYLMFLRQCSSSGKCIYYYVYDPHQKIDNLYKIKIPLLNCINKNITKVHMGVITDWGFISYLN